MTAHHEIRALLVDPSLYTAPYDSALTGGLLAAGVRPEWATRPLRAGERQEIPVERVEPFFYRRVDEAAWLPRRLRAPAKGLAHLWGLAGLVWRVLRRRPDVLHLQWTVLPPLDVLAMLVLRPWVPIVLTVHDTVPFNGERLSFLQNAGFDLPMRLAHRLIVHTESGRATLVARGVPAAKIEMVPHGSLRLAVPLPARPVSRDPRYAFLLFGEIKPYKGLDVLVEALGQIPAHQRARARLIVAGRPRMDLDPVRRRIAELGLGDTVELRPVRQSDEEMAALFAEADALVFPYRQIDASGVWFLTKSLGKWMIASRVGIFAQDLREGEQGVLLPPGDAPALAAALADAIERRPRSLSVSPGEEWQAIGLATRRVYESLLPAAPDRASARARVGADG